MSQTAQYWIGHLQLNPHPEGGYYREVYLSENRFKKREDDAFPSGRRFYSSIYYLLEKGQFSAFHRLKSNEIWHHYAGRSAEITILTGSGLKTMLLGKNLLKSEQFEQLVPANTWFTVAPSSGTNFVLCGCTMVPGFEFEDFELGTKKILLQQFPEFATLIKLRCIR